MTPRYKEYLQSTRRDPTEHPHTSVKASSTMKHGQSIDEAFWEAFWFHIYDRGNMSNQQNSKVTALASQPLTTASSNQVFRLFDLPPELWIRICRFAVARPGPIVLYHPGLNRNQQLLMQQPPITRASRLLRRETLPFFYSKNTFEVLDSSLHWAPLKWIKSLVYQKRMAMGTVKFRGSYDPADWVQVLEGAGVKVTLIKVIQAFARSNRPPFVVRIAPEYSFVLKFV